MASSQESHMQAYDRFVRKRRLENGPAAFQDDWKPRDVLTCRLRSCQQSPDEPRRLGNLSDMQVLVDFENFRKSQATWEDLREVANISGLKPQCKRYICHLACIVLLQYVAGRHSNSMRRCRSTKTSRLRGRRFEAGWSDLRHGLLLECSKLL